MLALFVTENLGGIYFCYMVAGTKFKILENALKNSSLFPYTAIHYVQTITCPGVKKITYTFSLDHSDIPQELLSFIREPEISLSYH